MTKTGCGQTYLFMLLDKTEWYVLGAKNIVLIFGLI